MILGALKAGHDTVKLLLEASSKPRCKQRSDFFKHLRG